MSFFKDLGKKFEDFLITSTPAGSVVDVMQCPHCKKKGSLADASFTHLGNHQAKCNSCGRIVNAFAKCPNCGYIGWTVISGFKESCKKCGYTASTHDFEKVLK